MELSNGTFVIALAAGAAMLAMWVHARFPGLAPERLGRAMLHAVTAFALLKATALLGDGTAAFATVFLFVLPALVYALLCTLWLVKHAQSALGSR
jgi:hypothetical protein